MKSNKLLVAAALATAMTAPIAPVAGETNVTQSTTSPGVRVPFLHWFGSGQVAGQSELASLEGAEHGLLAD